MSRVIPRQSPNTCSKIRAEGGQFAIIFASGLRTPCARTALVAVGNHFMRPDNSEFPVWILPAERDGLFWCLTEGLLGNLGGFEGSSPEGAPILEFLFSSFYKAHPD